MLNNDAKDISSKDREVFLRKIAEVAKYVETAEISNLSGNFFQADKFNLQANPFFGPLELMCDSQNIPKWWRQVFNWAGDITISLAWALGWFRFLDLRRIHFKEEGGQSGFLAFAKSPQFDGEAWIYARHHLDNAIFRLYSFREKIAWLLNCHSQLHMIDSVHKNISFVGYLQAIKKESQPIYDLLGGLNSEKARQLMKYYRNQFVHNETPSVDWPKEPSASIVIQYDTNGKEVSRKAGLYGLRPPDFELNILLQDSVTVWNEFVEGTERLGGYLNKTYYSEMSADQEP